ncbi:MAG: hypothetical protein Q7R54_01685 [bacterium]|nr:hypothetical protein [bacterium]
MSETEPNDWIEWPPGSRCYRPFDSKVHLNSPDRAAVDRRAEWDAKREALKREQEIKEEKLVSSVSTNFRVMACVAAASFLGYFAFQNIFATPEPYDLSTVERRQAVIRYFRNGKSCASQPMPYAQAAERWRDDVLALEEEENPTLIEEGGPLWGEGWEPCL